MFLLSQQVVVPFDLVDCSCAPTALLPHLQQQLLGWWSAASTTPTGLQNECWNFATRRRTLQTDRNVVDVHRFVFAIVRMLAVFLRIYKAIKITPHASRSYSACLLCLVATAIPTFLACDELSKYDKNEQAKNKTLKNNKRNNWIPIFRLNYPEKKTKS